MLNEKMETIGISRSEKLKTRLLSLPREVCTERARLITESYKETEGEPVPIRRAKALRKILSNLSVNIWSDELIVGNITSRELGAGIYPETIGGWIDGELDELKERVPNPFLVKPEEVEKLRKEVFPYWEGKNIPDIVDSLWPKDISDIHFSGQAFIITEFAGFGHIVLNHEKVLSTGLAEVIKEADEYLSKSGDPEKRNFYEAVKIVCQAVINFADRYAEKAESLLLGEKDEGRRKELENIAKICRKVPAKPAETFWEALQAIYFTQLAAGIEDYESAISIGRIDRLLYLFYKADIEKGKISRGEAQILLECFFLKLSSIIPLWNYFTTMYFGGFQVGQTVVIGGVDENGNDVTNEVSYLALGARKKSHQNPNFGVRVHENISPEFLERACEAALRGTSLFFYNDGITIPALMRAGIPREDALNYAIDGCVELGIPGKSFPSGDAGLFNLAFCLELALNRGLKFGKKIGVETKDPREFETMEDLMKSFSDQVNFLASKFIEGLNLMGKVHAKHRPLPFISALTEGCLESGKDVTQGGAIYNSTACQAVGVATVADSLATIDKLVFKEKRISMEELLDALDSNFEGKESLRQLLVNKVPKYGNDDDEADKYARRCVEIWYEAIRDYRNYRGGKLWPGLLSTTTHVPFGLQTGALPNGRKAGEPLSPGISASQGMANSGPTAVLKSASKVDYKLTPNGVALNLEFGPGYFKGKEGTENFAALLKGFFALGGMHMHCNFIGRETLLAAKKNPEKYKHLMVRVAGFSAAFVDLDPAVQDEIISRTEFS